jgi:hypothetical protein
MESAANTAKLGAGTRFHSIAAAHQLAGAAAQILLKLDDGLLQERMVLASDNSALGPKSYCKASTVAQLNVVHWHTDAALPLDSA